MTTIRNKLDLYGSSPAETTPGNVIPETRDPESGSRFDGIDLENIAPGVFRRKLFLDECENEFSMHANLNLEKYKPLSLTGILELSLTPHKEIIHPTEVLFLDTETTGLSRGAGTFPFLTGCAYFVEGQLCLEQIFLEDIAGESDYLEYIGILFARRPFLVTYNGKTFDLPLIRNRLVLNRQKNVNPQLHFDLLHILKRLVRRREGLRYRQKDMEMELLSLERKEELTGADVPQIYFDYKKYGECSRIPEIFYHNLFDITGMVFIFLEAIRLYNERDLSGPEIRWGLARILARNRKTEEAISLLSEIKPGEDPSREDHLNLLFLAGLYRSRGEWTRATELYSEISSRYNCPYSILSLAKIREHREKDYAGALKITLDLIDRLHAPERLPHQGRKYSGPFKLDALERRRKRLEGKIEKSRT